MKKTNIFLLIITINLISFLSESALGQSTVNDTNNVADALPAFVTFTTTQGNALSGEAINIHVWKGHATAIDFSRTGEFITSILLADPSKLVYTTNAVDLNSQQAHVIFLRRIQPLEFPLTTAETTNIFVTTGTSDGYTQLYTFNIQFLHGTPFYSGISLVHPAGHQRLAQAIDVGYSSTATLDDMERGLEVALELNYTDVNEPVVLRVKDFLALARNGTPILEAASLAGVSLSLISELGRLGLENAILQRPTIEIRPTE